MSDSPILTPEEVNQALTRTMGTRWVGSQYEAGGIVLASHEALRAALAAAQQEVERQKALMLRQTNLNTEAIMQRIAAEERAERAERRADREKAVATAAETGIARLVAERDQAIRERDDLIAGRTSRVTLRIERERQQALAQNRTLREALTEYAHHNGSCRYSGMHWTPTMVGGRCTCGLDAALGEKPMKHSDLPKHCSTCGIDWPEGANAICPSCGAGLCCRADTTDTVAPDPPCAGSRLRLKEKNDGT